MKEMCNAVIIVEPMGFGVAVMHSDTPDGGSDPVVRGRGEMG